MTATVPVALHREVSFLLAEAIANAVRHARVSEITARLTLRKSQLRLTLAGRCEVPGLALPQTTPRSIDERVAELGGSVTLELRGSDVMLKTQLPMVH